MKKILVFFMISILFIPNIVHAEDITPNAKSSILIEASTGKILYEKNKDERLYIASLTKMMSQIIILEEIENGNLKWEDEITTSANAAGYGGTQIYLQPGEVMTVRDLMKGISMASANDATVVLVERISGSEEKFVERMNNKVKELGLQNTNFVNVTGLDEENNYSSSYDLAIIASELLKHKEILEFSSLYEDYLRKDTNNKFWLVNTNKLVRTYEGVDGLKTGFTDNAKYCMAVTANKNNMRLIAIVLGEEVSKTRNKETTDLLNYGFNNYKINMFKKKNDVVKKIKINRANKESIDAILKEDIKILENISDNKKYTEKVKINDLKLPITKNQIIGILEVYDGNTKIKDYELVSSDRVKTKSIISIYFDNLKKII